MSNPPINEEAIFASAIEIDDRAKRGAYLDEACGGDDRLRASVGELLALHDTAGDFLDTPPLGHVAGGDVEQPGAVIGRYRLVERVGEGGFGVVWKARQEEPMRREVALKIVKLGMDTEQIITRFEAEHQALAMMNHANIATVLDAGSTERGRPYFVMELVEGQSIDTFCDERCLTVRERLELFTLVCRAVQHAHQKGIVHRDLKPTNVLVAAVDGQAAPKIIDFGIAKAMDARMGRVSRLPEAGEGSRDVGHLPRNDSANTAHHLVGTPEYMSPEQVLRHPDIDTRADVYALGGVLYKILVGAAPLDTTAARRAGFDELCRIIREEAPVPPSQRARVEETTALARRAEPDPSSSATARRAAPAARPASGHGGGVSPRSLRGDLDWIVMKALEKDRTRRYESAAELARDIERHLTFQTVLAGPRGVAYRARKFVRRNRVRMFAASLVLVALFAAAIGWVRAEREGHNAHQQRQLADFERRIAEHERTEAEHQRRLAQVEAEKALRIAEMLETIVAAASPRLGSGVDFTVRQLLDEFAESLGGRLEDHPEVESKLRLTIGRAYQDLAEVDKAGPHLKRALDLRRTLFLDDDPLVLESRVDYAMYLVFASQVQEAKRHIDAALPPLRQAGPSVTLARALHCVDRIHAAQYDFEGAYQCAQEAWEVACEVHGPGHWESLDCQSRVGAAAALAGELDEAERLTRDALQRLRDEWPNRRFHTGFAQRRLARVLNDRRELDEAERLIREVLDEHLELVGEGSKHVVYDMTTLANILWRNGKRAEAEKTARAAVDRADRLTDERTLARASAYQQLAAIVERDSPDEAVDLRREEVEARRSIMGSHPAVAMQLRRLAGQLRELGRWNEAAACYREAISILHEHPDRLQGMGITQHRLADLLRASGDPSQAAVQLRAATSTHDPAGFYSAIVRIDWIETLIELDDVDQARWLTDEWLRLAESGDRPELAAAAHTAQAQLLIAAEEYDAAERALLNALDRYRTSIHRRTRERIHGALAHCRIRMGHYEAAETILLRQQKDDRTARSPLDVYRVARQLESLYEAWGKPRPGPSGD